VAKIVVGVDGSDHARRALLWAADEARLRGADLHVVHVWQQPLLYLFDESWVPEEGAQTVWAKYGEQAGERLAAFLSEQGDALQGIEVEPAVVEGVPAEALLEAARDAALLVVGSRGHGGFAGLPLGSVGQQVAAHAACPVVIVRNEE
jgi:nucleotide-binding universal stress UspA family protein